MPSLESAERVQGAYPLMTTQYRPDGEELISRRKDRVRLWKPWYSEQTWILPESGDGVQNLESVRAYDTGAGKIRRVYVCPQER